MNKLILYFRGQRERGHGEEHSVTSRCHIDDRNEVILTSVTQ
jgi:hypothetical protein